MKIIKKLVLKGNIAYTGLTGDFYCHKESYLVCSEGRVCGVFDELPKEYQDWPVKDYGDCLIMPGMTDLHLHAPQYTFRGTGMDMELLEWLQVNTFPEEARYADPEYAIRAYRIFADDLKNSLTTRACIFATIHNDATTILMDMLEESGLVTYVGRVNMDRNGGNNLCEESAQKSAEETELWIQSVSGKYSYTKPILTPRFIPSCTDELMQRLSVLQKKYQLPVQSHLSENLSEIEWVKELVPEASSYGAAYDLFGMFGSQEKPAIMAHCVYSSPEETALMKKRGVYVAHSPESNLNIASGIAPVRSYLQEGIHVGLATDVAGGSSLSMLKAMALAVQSSKMYWRLIDQSKEPLSFEEVFYLATLGGGSYFGKSGTFLPGYEFDVVIVDDSAVKSTAQMKLRDRFERMIYQSENIKMKAKFVAGRQII